MITYRFLHSSTSNNIELAHFFTGFFIHKILNLTYFGSEIRHLLAYFPQVGVPKLPTSFLISCLEAEVS